LVRSRGRHRVCDGPRRLRRARRLTVGQVLGDSAHDAIDERRRFAGSWAHALALGAPQIPAAAGHVMRLRTASGPLRVEREAGQPVVVTGSVAGVRL